MVPLGQLIAVSWGPVVITLCQKAATCLLGLVVALVIARWSNIQQHRRAAEQETNDEDASARTPNSDQPIGSDVVRYGASDSTTTATSCTWLCLQANDHEADTPPTTSSSNGTVVRGTSSDALSGPPKCVDLHLAENESKHQPGPVPAPAPESRDTLPSCSHSHQGGQLAYGRRQASDVDTVDIETKRKDPDAASSNDGSLSSHYTPPASNTYTSGSTSYDGACDFGTDWVPSLEGYNLQGLPTQQVKGLYPIICEQQEQQNGHMVNKILSLKPHYLRLTADLVPTAAASARAAAMAAPAERQHINFEALGLAIPNLRCMGVYGSIGSVLRFLQEQYRMPQQLALQLAEQDGAYTLRPGITAWAPALTPPSCGDDTYASVGTPRCPAVGAHDQLGTQPYDRDNLPDLILLVVGNKFAFSNPTCVQTFNSYLRYSFDLCSDLVLVMSEEEAACFDHTLYPFSRQQKGEMSSYALARQTQEELSVILQGTGFTQSRLISGCQVTSPDSMPALEPSCCSASSPAIVCSWQEEAQIVKQKDVMQGPLREFPNVLQELQKQYSISIHDSLKKQLLMYGQGRASTAVTGLLQKPLVQLLIATNPRMDVVVRKVAEEINEYPLLYRKRRQELEFQVHDQQVKECELLKRAMQDAAACWSSQGAPTAGQPATDGIATQEQQTFSGADDGDNGQHQQGPGLLTCPVCTKTHDGTGMVNQVALLVSCKTDGHTLCKSCVTSFEQKYQRDEVVICAICSQHQQQAATDAADTLEHLERHRHDPELASGLLADYLDTLSGRYHYPNPVNAAVYPFTCEEMEHLADDLLRKRFLAKVLSSYHTSLLPRELPDYNAVEEFFKAALSTTSDRMLHFAVQAAKSVKGSFYLSQWVGGWLTGEYSARKTVSTLAARADAELMAVQVDDPEYYQQLHAEACATAVDFLIERWLDKLQSLQKQQLPRLQQAKVRAFVETEQSAEDYRISRLQSLVEAAEQQLQSPPATTDAIWVGTPAKLQLQIISYSQADARYELDQYDTSRSVPVPAKFELRFEAERHVAGRRRHVLHQLLPATQSSAALGQVSAPDIDALPVMQLPPHQTLLLAQAVETRPGMFMYVVSGPIASTGQNSQCRVYLSHRGGNPMSDTSTLLRLNKSITVASFDQSTRLLLLVCAEDQLARLYLFDEHYMSPRQLQDIKLADLLPNTTQVMLVPGKKEALLFTPTHGYLYDIVNNRIRSAELELPPTNSKYWVLPAPEGSVVAVLTQQGPVACETNVHTSSNTHTNMDDSKAVASCCADRIAFQSDASDGTTSTQEQASASRSSHTCLEREGKRAPTTSSGSAKNENCSSTSCCAQDGQWILHTYCLEAEADKPLLSEIQPPVALGQCLPVGSDSVFRLCRIGDKTHLVAFDITPTSDTSTSCIPRVVCRSLVLHITNFSQSNVLKPKGRADNATGGIRASGSAANAMLDYLYSIFDKFPATSALGQSPGQVKLWVMVAQGSKSPPVEKVASYISRLWLDVQNNTCKPFHGLEFTWQVLPHWRLADVLSTPKGHVEVLSSAQTPQLPLPGLGAWMETAMTLVPLQLCRCEGNSLWPMSDGLLLQLDEEDTDVNCVAAKISLGVYDVILSQPATAATAGGGGLPVVVVSSMGAQSTGKSYQLNHLAGCFFDVSGGRCTDGCWLSVRKHKLKDGQPCLLLLLDFEGIGSWERTEQEDMLLSLLSAAISNWTLFKTHFTFDRYTQQTLQRFNLGAPKVRAMCGGADARVFAGDIVFCLKDVVGFAVEEVKEEFHVKLVGIVQSSDNFLSALYQGELHLLDFPYPEDSRFYRQLESLVDAVMNTKPSFDSGNLLASQLRRLLAKISHKDWTPIHRDQVRSVVSALLARLNQACAAGCLSEILPGQASPPQTDLQHLMVMDTGRVVGDTALLQFEVQLSINTAGRIWEGAQLDRNVGNRLLQHLVSSKVTPALDQPQELLHALKIDAKSSDMNISKNSNGALDPETGSTFGACSASNIIDNNNNGTPKEAGCSEEASDTSASGSRNSSSSTSKQSGSATSSSSGACRQNSIGRAPPSTRLLVQVDVCDAGLLLSALGADDQLTSAHEQRNVIKQLIHCFLDLFPCCSAGQVDDKFLFNNLQAFFSALVARRKARVEQWASDNMRYFLEDHEAKKLLQAVVKGIEQVQLGLSLCGAKCNECFTPCVLPRAHSSDVQHDCLQDSHKCQHNCVYCADSNSTDLEQASSRCQGAAGHPGPHSCGDSNHECGKKCSLAGKSSNCAEHCCLLPGHEGEHRCGIETHLCAHVCSLNGCGSTCSLPYDHDPSRRHQCNKNACPMKCQLCQFPCSCDDHFHPEQPDALHLCGSSHSCSHACAAEGMCEIRSELRREKRVFAGARGEFEYDHITQQTCRRHQCVKEIPAGQLKHEGPCIHDQDESVVHFCGQACPNCGYRCTRPHGHEGRHETQHGNMRHTFFVSAVTQPREIDVGERKYVRGEWGVAETCDNYCSVMGRGHVHVLPCDPDKCDVGGQASLLEGQRRHARCQYSNGQSASEREPKDELTHDAYWEELGFEDPCSDQQQQEFRLCGAVCGSHAHDQDEAKGNDLPQCVLPMWHAPYKGSAEEVARLPPGVQVNHVTAAGHAYTCKHDSSTYGCYHTILVIDRSGSMDSTCILPVNPEVCATIRDTNLRLMNVAGVVCEAALAYMRNRQSRNCSDLVSCVTFNETSKLVFERRTLSSPGACTGLLRALMPEAVPCGGTVFWAGLSEAFGLLGRTSVTNTHSTQSAPRPVIVLLTDSDDWHKAHSLLKLQQALETQRRTASEEQVPQVHVIGYGRNVDERFLQQLADAGNGSYVACRQPESVDTSADVARLQLVSAFEQLADRPDRRGALMINQHRTV